MAVQPGDILEASPRLEFNSVDDQVNVFQFQNESVSPLTDTQGINDVIEVLEVLYTILVPLISILTVFRDIRVRNVTQSVVYGVFPWPTLTAGTQVQPAIPLACAGLLNFSTGIARVTPRKYFGSLTTTSIDSQGNLTAGTLALIASVGATLLTSMVATNASWNYGYFSPKTLGWQQAVSVVATNIPAYQRRRKPGRGA